MTTNDQLPAVEAGRTAPSGMRVRPERRPRRSVVTSIQIALVLGFLAFWQWVPGIPGVQSAVPFLDPYFISSPSRVIAQLWALLRGAGTVSVWPYFFATLTSSLVGIALGALLGAVVGLLLSNSVFLSEVCRPFLVAMNAIPRIALIPIIVMICGPTQQASVVTAILIVFFIVFFNAYEGGRSVPVHVIQNVQMLGASPTQVMMRIRLRYVQAWSFAALPNAVSFGLMAVVTAEILTGAKGLGRLLLESVTTVQSSLTFAVVLILSVVGLILVVGTDALTKRMLRWWFAERH